MSERGYRDMTTVANGVNVQALLDAREVLKGAPEAAQFTWRASAKWQSGVHSTIKVQSFFGLGEEQSHKEEWTFEADHPEVFAAEDDGITPIEYLLVGLASCLTAGVASVAENRGIQLRSVESDGRGRARHPRDPRCRQRRPQRLQRRQGDVHHRRGRVEAGDRGAGRPVPEALRRVRRSHEPDERHRRSRLSGRAAACPTRALRQAQGQAIERTTTVVIGAGHAGLAASHFLSDRSIDHVVLERGEVANSWRRERWDSLRLLTPNWQSRLPGLRYEGPDPDGYMTVGEVTEFIEHFAKVSRAPVRTGVNVTSVRRADDGYHVTTSRGEIRCRAVVIASGACNQPTVPRFNDAVPASVEQLTPFGYRDPAQLPDGGVLVVGALGDRRAAGRRAEAVGPAGDSLGGGARAVAAHVPRTRCAVVDGRVGRVGSAVRRG